MGGIPIPVGIAEGIKIRAEFDLPSGGHVIIRQGKGRDLRLGLMAAGPGADQYRILFSLMARVATIDGKMVTLEGIDEMDLEDVQTLIQEGSKVLTPLKKTPTKTLTLASAEDLQKTSDQLNMPEVVKVHFPEDGSPAEKRPNFLDMDQPTGIGQAAAEAASHHTE